MIDASRMKELKELAAGMRKELLKMSLGGHVHLGGDLSSTDFLTVMYQEKLNIRPDEPAWEGRDRVILSKGHGSAALYLAMAHRGYFSVEEVMTTYCKNETRFGLHPCKRECPILDASTGSLGHGLSMGVGIALGARKDGEDFRTYVILGDGEINEGSVWEAAMAGPQFKLGNLIAIVDRNRMSLDGPTEEIMGLDPLEDKWKAFGWNVLSIDGNDMQAVSDAFDSLPAADSDVPTVIIANTVKGKGVSFLEMIPRWHSGSVSEEEYKLACEEIDAALAAEV